MDKLLGSVCLGSVFVVVVGCNGKDSYPITGKVSFDGQPVSNGQILFIPADKSLSPAAGRIEDGEYRLQASTGSKRVEIRAARIVRAAKETIGPQYQDYIPAKFNTASTLTAEVKADDENRFDFHLEHVDER
jgi:hypothetical protein